MQRIHIFICYFQVDFAVWLKSSIWTKFEKNYYDFLGNYYYKKNETSKNAIKNESFSVDAAVVINKNLVCLFTIIQNCHDAHTLFSYFQKWFQ